MYFKSILALALVITLFSCSPEPKKTNENLATVSLSIEGMTCKEGCGGAIAKNLKKLDGVDETEVHFDSENPIDKVIVTFDPKLVTAEDMTAKVESIAKGAYKVTSVN